MENQNDMPIIDMDGFAGLLRHESLNIIIAEECQGLEFSFDRVKFPAGGGTTFEVPSDESAEGEPVKELTGVIIYNHPSNVYYQSKYAGGKNPPDCSSFDGVMGIGNPGGYCADCPYNKFGSGEGKGKLCKNKRTLYLLRPGERFPLTISLPVGSIKSFAQYVKSQLSKGRRISNVVTKISLKKAVNASGITYSQAVFTFDRVLTQEECDVIWDMSHMVTRYLDNLTLMYDGNIPHADAGEGIAPLK